MTTSEILAEHGRRDPRRNVVVALAVVIMLVAGLGLYVSAAPLFAGEPERRIHALAPHRGPDTVTPPAAKAPVAAPVQKAPTLPDAGTVPETRGGVSRPVACPAAPPAPPAAPTTAAYAAHHRLHLFGAPGGTVTKTLANPTRDGMTLIVRVLRKQGAWTLVHHPGRPNGARGWVRANDVVEYATPYHAVVELCAHRMTLYRGGQVVMQETVAVGAPRWPTPTGTFYVDYQYKTPRPSGSYGPWLLSIAGYSDVLHHFAGGIGQIAFHGTNAAWSIGKSVSHGCIRLRNDAVTRLQRYAAVGTPVTIVH